MPPLSDHVRFVAAVHRRMLGYRLLEIFVFAAAASALAAAIAERWTPSAATPTALLVAGAVIALLTRRRRPTLAAAARAIDSQFGWDELVQSARAASDTHDQVGQAVAASADARCRSARIGSLSLGRFTPRDTALVAAFVFSAIAIHISPRGVVGAAAGAPDDELAQSMDRPFTASSVAPRPGSSGTGSGEPDEPTRLDSVTEKDVNHLSRVAASGRSRNPVESAGGIGSGAAGGRTQPAAALPADAAGRASATAGSTAATGDGTSVPAGTGRGASTGVVTSAASTDTASQWSSGSVSPATDSTGDRAAGASSVPPADADLVRAFFTR